MKTTLVYTRTHRNVCARQLVKLSRLRSCCHFYGRPLIYHWNYHKIPINFRSLYCARCVRMENTAPAAQSHFTIRCCLLATFLFLQLRLIPSLRFVVYYFPLHYVLHYEFDTVDIVCYAIKEHALKSRKR